MLLSLDLQFLSMVHFACGVVFVLVTVGGVWLWQRLSLELRDRIRPGALCLAVAAMAVLMSCGKQIDSDEIEHLHTAWLMVNGQLPYVDFHQHHPPALWWLLAPLTRLVTHGTVAIDIARIIAIMLTGCACLAVVSITRRIHQQPHAWLWAMGLCFGIFKPGDFSRLRPDLPATVCVMVAIALLCGQRTVLAAAASGALIGMGVALCPKVLPLLILLPVVLLVERASLRAHLHSLVFTLTGIIVAAGPTILWLHERGIFDDFIDTTVAYNLRYAAAFGGHLPVILVILVVLWLTRGRSCDQTTGSTMASRVLMVAICLAALSYARTANSNLYSAQPLLLLLAVAGAGEAQRVIAGLLAGKRPVAVGALVGLYLLPSIGPMGYTLASRKYFRDKAQIRTVQAAAPQGQSVFCLTPMHPIGRTDAIGIFLPSFFQEKRLAGLGPRDRERLGSIPARLAHSRPSLILAQPDRDSDMGTQAEVPRHQELSYVVYYLLDNGLITRQEGEQLQAFLDENYHLVRLGSYRREYWARNDLTPGGEQ